MSRVRGTSALMSLVIGSKRKCGQKVKMFLLAYDQSVGLLHTLVVEVDVSRAQPVEQRNTQRPDVMGCDDDNGWF